MGLYESSQIYSIDQFVYFYARIILFLFAEQLEIWNGDMSSNFFIQDCFGYPFIFPYKIENYFFNFFEDLY